MIVSCAPVAVKMLYAVAFAGAVLVGFIIGWWQRKP